MRDITSYPDEALGALVFALPCLAKKRHSTELMGIVDSMFTYTSAQEYALKRDLFIDRKGVEL